MIYLPRTAENLDVFFPNPSGFVPDEGQAAPGASVEIVSNVGLMSATIKGAPRYYHGYIRLNVASLQLPEELPTGEYTYRVLREDDGGVLSRGLLTLGDTAPGAERYEQKIEYIQYE